MQNFNYAANAIRLSLMSENYYCFLLSYPGKGTICFNLLDIYALPICPSFSNQGIPANQVQELNNMLVSIKL